MNRALTLTKQKKERGKQKRLLSSHNPSDMSLQITSLPSSPPPRLNPTHSLYNPASPGNNVPFSTAASCALATYPYTGRYWSRKGSSCALPGVLRQSRIRSMTMAKKPCSITPAFSMRRFASEARRWEKVPLASVLAKTV